MAKYIQIQVDHPCSEDWHDMTKNAEGSFCSSCKKTVIDFTAMTDNQLMEYFKKNPVNSCGRFYTDQLEAPLAIPVKKIPWVKYFFQISLPAMLIGFKSNAQRVVKKYQAPIAIIDKKTFSHVLQRSSLVSGKITNFAGEPIAYASVMVKGSTKGVAADSNGIFKLQLADNDRTLVITAAGYKDRSLTVENNYIDIQLDMATSDGIILDAVVFRSSRSITMGGYGRIVCSGTLVSKEKKDNIETTKPGTATMFPNPANKNSMVTIEWKNKVSNDQLLTIYNAAGQKLQQQMIHINQPTLQYQLNLHISNAGHYILQITDNKTYYKQAIPFVVE